MTQVLQNIIQNVQANAPKMALGNAHFWEREYDPMQIKNLLQDINSEKQQMEGLKMTIAAMSKGQNVSELFPDVVKLVASQNSEIKKMVYIYLIQYAEIEQNASLLAINILKKNISNTNQLVRAQALRTLSSFRVLMILQVVMASIVGGVKDSSPYVRKTAAHAIGKIFSLDPSQKDTLVECIEKLLKDRSPMVLGSAVAAFEEVCPDRFDLIHPNFRKFCDILPDIDEWGQAVVVGMLTRYGRSQFTDPDKAKEEKEKEKKEDDYLGELTGTGEVDSDHRILLNSVFPLLHSRNAAVIQSVATLYFYLAPVAEKHKVAKPLVRVLRNAREIQYTVLLTIRSMASVHPDLFQPYLPEFFIETSEPNFTRKLKIEIMTLLANESNIDRILREFNYYTTREDKEFVAEVIQAIGKCAARIPEVTDRCMVQLMQLLGSKSEAVVAEAVVIIKQLLQMPQNVEGSQNDEVIKQLTRLFNKVKNPKARASIIWVVGEYVDKVSTYAPDILRQLAKEFCESDDIVKHQILNLGAKLIIKNPSQTGLIFQYILNLAKFDMNYDIRDKSRMMRHILLNPGEKLPVLHAAAQKLYITTKPSPNIPLPTIGRFVIGSLAQIVNHTTPNYLPLSDWADTVQNSELRVAETFVEPESSYVNSPFATLPSQEKSFWDDEEEEKPGAGAGAGAGEGEGEGGEGEGEDWGEEWEEGEGEEGEGGEGEEWAEEGEWAEGDGEGEEWYEEGEEGEGYGDEEFGYDQ